MLKSCLKALGIAAVVSMTVGSAQATMVSLESGGLLCEGPAALLPAVCDGEPTFGDGTQTPPGASVLVNFAATDETGMIVGGIRGSETVFTDNFTLTGSGLYRLTLDLIGVFGPSAPDFDATWTQAGAEIGVLGTAVAGGVSSLTTDVVLTAGSLFSLNAAGGNIQDGTVGQYKLTVTSVPLPAGAVLLLSGLGGLALARRRTKA